MSDDPLDLIAIRHSVVDIAEAAGQILIEHFGRVFAHRKPDGTLVTAADHAADRYITEALNVDFPGYAILSEEHTTHYASPPCYTWVVDPLDGTTNYANGLPLFGVSIALLKDGAPIVGVLGFPMLHEVYSATLRGRAFRNHEPITTDPNALPDDQQFLMQCTRTSRHYTIHTPLKPRILGSAAYHIASVAGGSALAAVEATPKVWDLAAAYLILLEAGGVMRSLNQATLFPLDPSPRDYKNIAMPILAAANVACLQQVFNGINPH